MKRITSKLYFMRCNTFFNMFVETLETGEVFVVGKESTVKTWIMRTIHGS
jgi:hypothetical protein